MDTLKGYLPPPKDKAIIEKKQRKVIMHMNLSFLDYLDEKATITLKKLLIDSVIGGLKEKIFNKAIEETLPDEYKTQTKLIAQTLKNMYFQAFEDAMVDSFKKFWGKPYWEYCGPTDNLNRDECVWAMDKCFFTNEERIDFENKIGIRLGCRHIFKLVNEDTEKQYLDQGLIDIEMERRKEVIKRMEKIYGKKDCL